MKQKAEKGRAAKGKAAKGKAAEQTTVVPAGAAAVVTPKTGPESPLTGTSPGRSGELAALLIAAVLLLIGAASYAEVSDWGTLTKTEHQFLLAPILGGAAGWLAILIRRHEIKSPRDAGAAAVIGILGGSLGAVAALTANKDASNSALGLAALVGALAGAEGIKRVIDASVGPAVDDAKVEGDQVALKGRDLAVGQRITVQDQVAVIANASTDGTTATATLAAAPDMAEGPVRVNLIAPGPGVPVSSS